MLITADSPHCQDCDNVCLREKRDGAKQTVGEGEAGEWWWRGEAQTDWVEQGGESVKIWNDIQKYTLPMERWTYCSFDVLYLVFQGLFLWVRVAQPRWEMRSGRALADGGLISSNGPGGRRGRGWRAQSGREGEGGSWAEKDRGKG